ncbi:MAG: hypothetical protein GY947_13400 [Rhodobacteraceae bacterium]|nr:hypothetical protein [Paracoccaceae bacterium]
MALPLAPIAITAARYGTVAAIAYYAARKVKLSQTDQAVEDSLDKVEEGVCAHKCSDAPQANASTRWRRVIRLGDNGPGLEIDIAAMGRVRIKKV